MERLRQVVVSILFAAVLPSTFEIYGQTATPADSIADAVGVNTHFGDFGTAYTSHADLVVGLMTEMGLRHFRDGIAYLGNNAPFPAQSYATFNSLGSFGLKGDYIASCSMSSSEISQVFAMIDNVESIEYPNEYDISGDVNWAATLRQCGNAAEPQLSALTGLQFVGPSLVEMGSPTLLGPVPMTANNLHFYYNNYPPDLNYTIGSTAGPNAGGGPCIKNAEGGWDCFPGLRYQIDNVQADGPGKPIWITETGYVTSGVATTPGQSQYVPAQYEPAYFIREVLWALKNGVPRVYFYSMIDDPSAAFGLVDQSLQPKPAFYALANLIHLMADTGAWTGVPATLNYTLAGGDSFLMHSLFQKTDGTFYLALWLAASDWNGSQDITPAPESVTLSVPDHTIVDSELMQTNGFFLPSVINQSSVVLSVSTSPIFIRIE